MTSAKLGLVAAEPSGKTTVGTVRFPRLTSSTYDAASGVRSMSTSRYPIPSRSSCVFRRRQKPHQLVVYIVISPTPCPTPGVPSLFPGTNPAADISRTTAYRYFPNQRSLLAAAHPETTAASLLPPDPPDDPALRLTTVVEAFTQIIIDTEAQQRTMLRLSLEADPVERKDLPLRQGRAIGWIEEALLPLRGELPDRAIHELVLAIRSATGIETLAWLTDVAGLPRGDAVNLMRWSAQALLHAALTGFPPTGGQCSRGASGD